MSVFFFFPECSHKKDHTAWAKFKLLLFFFCFCYWYSFLSARAIRSWLYLVVIHHYLEVLVCHWKVSILLTECFASFSSPYQTCVFIDMFSAMSNAVWRAANWGRTDLTCEQWLYHITPSWEFSSWQMPEDSDFLAGWHSSCGNASSELTNEEYLSGQRRNSDQSE